MSNLLDAISDVGEVIYSGTDRPLNLNPVLEIASERLGAVKAFLFLNQPEEDRLVLAGSSGMNVSEFRRLEAQFESPSIKAALESNRPEYIGGLEADSSIGFLAEDEPRSLLATGVRVGRSALGVLGFVFDGDLKNTEEIAKPVAVIASMLGQSLRVERAVRGERQKLIEENSHLLQELKEKHDFSHIVGTSNPMKQVYDQVSQVARSNATVLLRGESGTGKEMIANAIHYNSLRAKRPLVKINCAALPDTLIEAELFGHEKGAFTGADRFKKGRFEMAEGGTLFLDEIGDLPLQTQIKLLRVLQEREFERLGGTDTIKTNIRLITATNKNLEEAIAAGEFREDLYYRLNVFTIFLPPLRERKSDVLLLAEHFLEKYEQEHGKRIRRISTPAIDMLMAYHFPGNVRELENAIERAVLVCDSNVIHSHHLPPTLQTAEVSGTVTALTLKSAVEAFERGLIQDTLKSTKGNIAKAARQLDSTERILSYKIRSYGIDPRRFRS
ncbi:MAG TPA: sigma 54-interacting transcriptional regulator [Pyrinomonadaceae bacterium]|nr:sigma 54-interacting transcriptional regulator [Pyrinomonadaceae bacterium]